MTFLWEVTGRHGYHRTSASSASSGARLRHTGEIEPMVGVSNSANECIKTMFVS